MAEAAVIPKECVVCHGRFAAKRHTAKYCSERCRKRAQRQLENPLPPAAVTSMGVVKLAAPPTEGRGIYSITKNVLEQAERLYTPMGQAAMLIAEILSSGVQDTGSSIAALIRQYDVSLTKALDGTQQELTPLEKIRREREMKTG